MIQGIGTRCIGRFTREQCEGNVKGVVEESAKRLPDHWVTFG